MRYFLPHYFVDAVFLSAMKTVWGHVDLDHRTADGTSAHEGILIMAIVKSRTMGASVMT